MMVLKGFFEKLYVIFASFFRLHFILFEMYKFNLSEKYRKYLIELRFGYRRFYTVWGADMADGESDKMLVNDKKLILFDSLQDIGVKLEEVSSPYMDEENFRKWSRSENLQEIYNINLLYLLPNLRFEILASQEHALEILNCINLIQDFSIQVDHPVLESFFDDPLLRSLKGFIYDNYFWEPEEDTPGLESLDFDGCATLLNRLYDAFVQDTEIIA